jgi:type II secretory pathway component GspD/PulD (secretin)
LTFLFLLICFLLVSCAHKQPPLEERLLVRMSSLYAPKGQQLAPLEQEKETGKPQKTRKAAFKEVMPLKYHDASGIKPSIQKLPFSKSKEVSVAVDENRNALIIYATPKKYKALESLLKKLDVMPVQVLIEASVAEVTLKDSLKYGLEWFLKNTDGSQTNILRTLGGLGGVGGGLDYSIITDSKKFQLFLNALAQEDMVKILSSPRITVRDGKSASIIVGTEVPVITSEATSPDVQEEGTSGIIRSVQYRSTGVSLQVTPSVHARGDCHTGDKPGSQRGPDQ